MVFLHAREWIEIVNSNSSSQIIKSFSMRESGLKSTLQYDTEIKMESFSMRESGLK